MTMCNLSMRHLASFSPSSAYSFLPATLVCPNVMLACCVCFWQHVHAMLSGTLAFRCLLTLKRPEQLCCDMQAAVLLQGQLAVTAEDAEGALLAATGTSCTMLFCRNSMLSLPFFRHTCLGQLVLAEEEMTAKTLHACLITLKQPPTPHAVTGWPCKDMIDVECPLLLCQDSSSIVAIMMCFRHLSMDLLNSFLKSLSFAP